MQQSTTGTEQPTGRWTLPRLKLSIMASLLISTIALAVVPLIVFALLTGADSEEAMAELARKNLSNLADTKAEEIALQLKRMEMGTALIADQAAYLLEEQVDKATMAERLAQYSRNDKGIYGRDAYQAAHPDQDLSNVFVNPNVPLSSQVKHDVVRSEALEPLLQGLKRHNPHALFVYVVTESGVGRIYPWVPNEVLDPSWEPRQESFYQLAGETSNPQKHPIWTKPYPDPAGTGWIVTNAAPIYDSQGRFLGVIAQDLPKKELVNIALDIKVGETGYGFLIDSDGDVVVHRRYAEIDEKQEKVNLLQEADETTSVRGLRPILERMIGGEQGLDRYWEEGEQQLIAFAPIEGPGWNLGVVVPQNEVLEAVIRLRNIGLGLLLALAVLSVAIAVILSRSITRPIHRLRQGVEVIERGDLSHRLDIQSTNEIGALAASFNRMAENLQSTIQRIRQASLLISSSSEQIAATTRDQAGASAQQAAAVNQTTATMDELATTAAQIAESAERVARDAAYTQKNTQDGVSAVTDTVRKMEDIRQGTEISIEEIKALGQRSQQIGQVMEIINTIADQTKLIAFNAALEAATAGETGRRFGVVATEVRRLAGDVTGATKKIKERIAEIQVAVNALLEASEEQDNRVDEGVNHTQMTATVLEKILDSAGSTATSAEQIAFSTQQQRTAAEQTVEALREVARGAKQVENGSRQTAQVVTDLLRLAEKLREAVEHFQVGEVEQRTFEVAVSPTGGEDDETTFILPPQRRT